MEIEMYYVFLFGDTAAISQYPGEFDLGFLLDGPFSDETAAQQSLVNHLDNESRDLHYDYEIL